MKEKVVSTIKRKKYLSLAVVVCLLLIILSFLAVWRSRNGTTIDYNQTYTFSTHQAGGEPPTYIKFLDKNTYVAVPLLRVKDDYNQAFGVAFIRGKYGKHNNVFVLGKKVNKTVLWFDSYADFKKGDYTLQHPWVTSKNKTYTFEGSCIKKRNFSYYYRWILKINKTGKSDTYNSEYIRLKKAKLDLPTTQKEFIHQYHQKQ